VLVPNGLSWRELMAGAKRQLPRLVSGPAAARLPSGRVVARRRAHFVDHRPVAVPLQRLGGEDRFSPARLVGKLANICGDIGPQSAKDMSLFKQLTGGDRIQAERKFHEPFEFISGATPVFSANEFPGSPDTTRAYKGRWAAVEWPRQFDENASMERQLKLLGEGRGELLAGCREAQVGEVGAQLLARRRARRGPAPRRRERVAVPPETAEKVAGAVVRLRS
jgi:hypothetical protein